MKLACVQVGGGWENLMFLSELLGSSAELIVEMMGLRVK